MIFEVIIILAIVVVLAILIHRIPLAKRYQKTQEPELSEKEMTTFGIISNADDAFDRKDFKRAEELYIKAASMEPNNFKIYNRLGAIYLEKQNYYDAKESFFVAIRLDPSKASCHVNLGLAFMGLKDYFKAEQAFLEALKLDPKNEKYKKLLDESKNK